MPIENDNYDIIFIGSGIGTLTTAAILAKRFGKRCLILERHYQVGGFTHTFRRPGNNEWDVGVHYIGDMNEGATLSKISDYISDGKLKWTRMNDPFDVFEYPDLTFGQMGDKKTFIADLVAKFPDEEAGIMGYFDDLKTARKFHYWRLMVEVAPAFFRPLARYLMRRQEGTALATAGDVIARRIKDKKLKAVLLSQWGDYGLPPSKAAFATHSLVANHYLHGGYYPTGGAGNIANTIMPVIEAAGGKVLINHEVKEILIENGRAVGVEVLAKKGKSGGELVRYHAKTVVSCAGAYLTYDKLLPKEIGQQYAKEIEHLVPSLSTAVLYISLKESPEILGFKGENHWIFDGYDHDSYAEGTGLSTGKARGCYLSIPSLKNPEVHNHSAELIGFVNWEDFAEWQDKSWMKRGKDYSALKDKIAQSLFDLVEERHPGFRNLVSYYDISTPLSTQHFTGQVKGMIYGLAGTPDRYKHKCVGVRTPVKGLYLTGADAYSLGVGGAMISGVATAGVLSGRFGFFRNWKIILGK